MVPFEFLRREGMSEVKGESILQNRDHAKSTTLPLKASSELMLLELEPVVQIDMVPSCPPNARIPMYSPLSPFFFSNIPGENFFQ